MLDKRALGYRILQILKDRFSGCKEIDLFSVLCGTLFHENISVSMNDFQDAWQALEVEGKVGSVVYSHKEGPGHPVRCKFIYIIG